MQKGILWSIFLIIGIKWGVAQEGLVINEVGTGSDKYIELVVIGEPCEYVNLQGWVIDDNNGVFTDCDEALAGTGINTGHIIFSNSLTWEAIPVGTIILINNDASTLDAVFCEDYFIQVNFESEDDFFSPLFLRNTVSPRVSTLGNECNNQDCENNNGNTSYSGGSYSVISGSNIMDNSVVALNNQKDGIQVRTPGFSFFNGFAWGVGNHPPCATSNPTMDGGPNNMLFPADDYFAFENIDNDNYEDPNNWTAGSDSPGEANSLENANWIANMRRPLEAPFRNIDCDPGLIGQVTIPISEQSDCSQDVYDVGFSTCNIYEYFWSVDDEEILELLSDPDDENYVFVQGLKRGTTILRMQITDEFPDLYSPGGHNIYEEEFYWEITVESFDASLEGNFSELCENSCEEITFNVEEYKPGETYFVEYYLEPYGDDIIEHIPGNQTIMVCMDADDLDPFYDQDNHILHLPKEDLGEEVSIQLLLAIQNSNDYCGIVDDTPIAFTLTDGIMPNPAPIITGNATVGITMVDLTSVEGSIANNGSAFNWYLDDQGNNVIGTPAEFPISQLADTVFVQVIDGPCTSEIMPVFILLQPEISGDFEISLDSVSFYCDDTGSGLDTTVVIRFPDDITLFDYRVVLIIDGDTSYMQSTGSDSLIISINDILDSALIYVDSIAINGGGDNFTGQSDTARIYVDDFIDLSFIPETISACEYFIIPEYLTLPDTLTILQNISNMEVYPGDTIFSDDFLVYSYQKGACFDVIVQDVIIDQPLSAGTGVDSSLCITALPDSLDLFNFLSGSYNPDGEWRLKAGPLITISETNKISVSELIENTYTLQYIVSGNACMLDTACVELTLLPDPNAGSDTSYTTTTELLELYSFFPGRSEDGVFTIDMVPTDTILSTDTLSPGTYNIIHRIQDELCGMSESTLTLTIVPCLVAGSDTTVIGCDTIRMVPDEWINGGDPTGRFVYNGSVIPGDDTLIINIAGDHLVYYIVDSGNNCVPEFDTAEIFISILSRPNAGRDTSYTTSLEMLDLYGFFPDRSGDGDFLLDGIPTNSIISADTLIPGNYTVTHRIQDVVCGSIESTLSLTIVPCLVAGQDTTIIGCNTINIIPEEWIDGGDPGGVFVYNGSGIPGEDSLSINRFGESIIYYIVDAGPGCMPEEDTARINITFLDPPYAGQDTSYSTGIELLDLYSFFPDRSEDGAFFLEGIPTGSELLTDTLLPGTYNLLHRIEDPLCGNSESLLQLTIVPCVIAGLDTALISCGQISIVPEDLLRMADDSGIFVFIGDTISGDEITDISITGTNNIFYIVQAAFGCIPATDTAVIAITILNEPYAGRDTMAMLIDGVINLYDYFPERSGDGYFFFSNDPLVVISEMLDIGMLSQGIYEISHAIDDVFCPADTAFLTLEVVSCLSAGRDTSIFVCREDMVDLTSLVSGGNGKIFNLEGMALTNPTAFDPNTVFGDNAFVEVIQPNSGCPDDTVGISIAIDNSVMLPPDVNVTRCGAITLTLDELTRGIPVFDPDHLTSGAIDDVDGNGDTILAASPLDLFLPVTVLPGEKRTLSFIFTPPLCAPDTIHFTIIPDRLPSAGTDTTINVCRNDLLDLTMIGIRAENLDYYLDQNLITSPAIFDPNSVGADAYQIMVVDETSECDSDTAFISINIDRTPMLPGDTLIQNCGRLDFDPWGFSDAHFNIDPDHILSGALDSILSNGDTILGASPINIGIDGERIVLEEGETRILTYVVESPFCGRDTMNVFLDALVQPRAGRDTSVVLNDSPIDLYTLLPDRTDEGSFELINAVRISNIFNPQNYNSSGVTVFHIVQAAGCTPDTAVIDINIVPCIGAGLDSLVMECGPIDIRPVTLLRNSGAGAFYVNGNIVMPSDIISIDEGDSLEILYITMMAFCPSDTANFLIRSQNLPEAGRDTSVFLCAGNVLVESLIDPLFPGGVLEDDNGQQIAPGFRLNDNQGIGEYKYYYIRESSFCPADTAIYTVTIIDEPSAGLDTVIVNCGTGTIIPNLYIREGVEGFFLYQNRIIPGDTIITLQGSVSTTIRHVIDESGGCASDTAFFQVVNEILPNAGLDSDTILCESQVVNLASFIKNGDSGGRFYNLANMELDSLVSIQDFGIHRFRYIVERGICGSDNALITIDNYGLTNTAITGSSGSLCEQESLIIGLPVLEDVVTFELSMIKINQTDGDSIEAVIIVNPGSSLNFYHTSGGINQFFDLESGKHYEIIFDSALFSNGCEVPTQWDTIEIWTDVAVEYMYTETLCGGEERIIGGTLFDENNPSGIVVLENAAINGCDSIIMVDLDFDNYTYGTFSGQLCESDQILLNGTLYNADNLNGVDTLEGASVDGCDSILTVTFTIVETKIERIEESYCGEDGSVIVNGVTYDFSNPQGIEMIAGGSVNGCDSMVEVNLEFLPIGLNDVNIGVCNTDFSTTINGTLYNFENRRGMDVLPGAAASGCDSIIDVNLTFIELGYEYEVLSPPCPGDSIGSVIITAWEGSLPAIITWANSLIEVNELPFTFDFPINQQFLLEILDENECNGTQLVRIMERQPIETAIISTSLGGNTYSLEVESSDVIAAYDWYPTENLTCTDCPNPQITLTDNDQYLYVDLITEDGCEVSDTVYLGFNLEEVVYSPTIFSPNQDGNNDTWTLYASPSSDLIFKQTNIYDRWGKLVYVLPSDAINNPNLGWDGGEHLPGVYVYRLEYEDRSGKSRIFTGDLTLIR